MIQPAIILDMSDLHKKYFWQQTVPFLQNKKDKWTLIFFVSLYVPLFLLIFQPYGVNNYDPTHKIGLVFMTAAFSFGFVNAVTIGLYEFHVAPYLFKNENWLLFTVRIVLELILLSSVTFLFYNILGDYHDWNLSSYLGFIRDVSLMSIIPFAFIFLYLNYRKSNQAIKQLEISNAQRSGDKLLNISSINGKEYLSLQENHLLFIEAQDNYVAVYHLENEITKKMLLRTTMKKLDKELNSSFIVRCHRSFMVNTGCIEKVSNRSHQLLLYLSGVKEPIPVSQSYRSSIKQFLSIHHI